jgi:hypothetical protein
MDSAQPSRFLRGQLSFIRRHQFDKPLEQIMTVLGAGAGFGVVLDGYFGAVFVANAVFFAVVV